jgi:hypothetical protein
MSQWGDIHAFKKNLVVIERGRDSNPCDSDMVQRQVSIAVGSYVRFNASSVAESGMGIYGNY